MNNSQTAQKKESKTGRIDEQQSAEMMKKPGYPVRLYTSFEADLDFEFGGTAMELDHRIKTWART